MGLSVGGEDTVVTAGGRTPSKSQELAEQQDTARVVSLCDRIEGEKSFSVHDIHYISLSMGQ